MNEGHPKDGSSLRIWKEKSIVFDQEPRTFQLGRLLFADPTGVVSGATPWVSNFEKTIDSITCAMLKKAAGRERTVTERILH